MQLYAIDQRLIPLEEPARSGPQAVVLTSGELEAPPSLPGLEGVLHHVPSAREAKVCKAEVRRDCLTGTLVLPAPCREGCPAALGFLLTDRWAVLVDDTGAVLPHLRQLTQEPPWPQGGVGRFFCALLEQLIARDLYHLEALEDRGEELEDQVLAGQLEGCNPAMSALRKQAAAWFRYYSQLDDVGHTLRENENGFFDQGEQRLFRMFEERVGRLREEAQLLRESCMQLQSLFQAEIDIRQNRIMKLLTIVTTIFLPLSLLAGWYGMNFAGMPELGWKYGYPAVIAVSVGIVLLSLWIMKKKKFW